MSRAGPPGVGLVRGRAAPAIILMEMARFRPRFPGPGQPTMPSIPGAAPGLRSCPTRGCKCNVLLASLKSHAKRYCLLICRARKILLLHWKNTADKPSEPGTSRSDVSVLGKCCAVPRQTPLLLLACWYARRGDKAGTGSGGVSLFRINFCRGRRWPTIW
jgi:hypothetical protein